ncbi:MAG: VWA domain-containing protein [bacterium]|jgi:Ca-activated chloride channel family protein|nr:VWA domain-containing protein [Betaproteobacteria bacterium]
MRFLWPDLLWLMLLVPVLAGAYIYALRRRRRSAVRYASLSLVRGALGPGQKVRRHLPPALLLAGLALALFAVARPMATITLPSEYTTLVLAIDVSRSMRAADVAPDRITAAQEAAKAFIESLPRNVRLGIATFAGTAAVVQVPTDNREDMVAAIDRFELQRGTATGSGLLVALSILFPDDGIDLESAVFGSGFSRNNRQGGEGTSASGGVSIDRKPAGEPKAPKRAMPVGSYKSGAIILMSDGRRTTGPDPVEAAKMAAERGVKVHTVAFGSKDGAPISVGGWSFYAMVDEEALKQVAKVTGGQFFQASSGDELKKIYENLGTEFALERRDTEVGALFAAVALLLLVLSGVLSVLWFHRPMPRAASVATTPAPAA